MENESKIPTSNKRSPRNRQNKKQEEVATLRNNGNKFSGIEK